MTITTRQGKGGRWRWFVVTGTQHRAMSSIRGFPTQQAALVDAQEIFGEHIYLEEADGRVLYAGKRDFQ